MWREPCSYSHSDDPLISRPLSACTIRAPQRRHSTSSPLGEPFPHCLSPPHACVFGQTLHGATGDRSPAARDDGGTQSDAWRFPPLVESVGIPPHRFSPEPRTLLNTNRRLFTRHLAKPLLFNGFPPAMFAVVDGSTNCGLQTRTLRRPAAGKCIFFGALVLGVQQEDGPLQGGRTVGRERSAMEALQGSAGAV